MEAAPQDLTTKLWPARYHSATFRDLEPSTTYAYRVGRDGGWSEWFQFRTAARKPEPFAFLYFGTDYQGLRVISLNSMGNIGLQTKWLEGVLADNPNKWTVLTFHYPVFSREGVESQQSREWKRLFDKHGVDLVLNGHEHSYARTGLEGSAVYVKSVSGSKMYEIERKPWMVRAARDTQLYQVIRIDGERLSFEARTATGCLYDAFDLEKQPGKPNRLVEKLPAGTPERMEASQPGSR